MQETTGCRRELEPVRCGFGIKSVPRGLCSGDLELRSETDEKIPAKFRNLEYHHRKGNIEWWMVDFLADAMPFSQAKCFVCLASEKSDKVETLIENREKLFSAKSGVIHFHGVRKLLGFDVRMCLQIEGREPKQIDLRAVELESEHEVTQRFETKVFGCRLRVDLTIFDEGRLIKSDVSILHSERAEHKGGFWDLGDAQSLFIEQWFIEIDCMQSITNEGCEDIHPVKLRWTHNFESSIFHSNELYLMIHQYSSGGENWNSEGHQDLSGVCPLSFRGFKETSANGTIHGYRSEPCVEFLFGDWSFGLFVPRFWQSFPNALEVCNKTVKWALLPKSDYVHELQGGESITKTIWFETRVDTKSVMRLAGISKPLMLWQILGAEGALIPEVSSKIAYQVDQENYLGEMWRGKDDFFSKREAIDEYGWRNFGDFWADHEQVYSECDGIITSHYNNQYDLLFGLLTEFQRTGNPKCFELARDLADHVLNTDIYKTTQDRAAYNNGMFWHTSHYRDAGTCSHRCYSKSMQHGRHAMSGGGLSNEHTYTQGFTLYYLLTGNREFRDAVIQMGNRVISMDDGNLHWLAPFSGLPTGAASATSSDAFHGLGRGVGNSINALIDSWILTRDEIYLDKADELIYRVIHPEDDFDHLGYNDIELRWSYPVGIQALLRYLMVVPERNRIHDYIVQSLASVGNWMLQRARLALDTPDALEFPTETWAAQDLRKSNCLLLIGQIPEIPNGSGMQKRGVELFDLAWIQLVSYKSSHFMRPRALVLQQLPWRYGQFPLGHLRASMAAQRPTPNRSVFVSQNQDFRAKVRRVSGLFKMLTRAAVNPFRFRFILKESILGRIYRSFRRLVIRRFF